MNQVRRLRGERPSASIVQGEGIEKNKPGKNRSHNRQEAKIINLIPQLELIPWSGLAQNIHVIFQLVWRERGLLSADII